MKEGCGQCSRGSETHPVSFCPPVQHFHTSSATYHPSSCVHPVPAVLQMKSPGISAAAPNSVGSHPGTGAGEKYYHLLMHHPAFPTAVPLITNTHTPCLSCSCATHHQHTHTHTHPAFPAAVPLITNTHTHAHPAFPAAVPLITNTPTHPHTHPHPHTPCLSCSCATHHQHTHAHTHTTPVHLVDSARQSLQPALELVHAICEGVGGGHQWAEPTGRKARTCARVHAWAIPGVEEGCAGVQIRTASCILFLIYCSGRNMQGDSLCVLFGASP
eukprot:1150373-Pelagomonas_calceolata.AAC.2